MRLNALTDDEAGSLVTKALNQFLNGLDENESVIDSIRERLLRNNVQTNIVDTIMARVEGEIGSRKGNIDSYTIEDC